METVTLLITPADVLMFRDSRPFGQVQTDTASEFPAPRTLAGAMRTWLLTTLGADLSQLRTAGSREKTTREILETRCCPPSHPAHWVLDARFIGPLAYNIEGEFPYFSMPRNLAIAQDKKYNKDESLLALRPMETTPPGWNPSTEMKHLRPLWTRCAQPWDLLEDDWFVDESNYRQYLKGNAFNSHGMKQYQELFIGEPRLGIGINSDKGVTREGDLYASVFMRPVEGYGFALSITAEVDGLAGKLGEVLSMRSWIRLGGEGKFAEIQLLRDRDSLLPAAPSSWPPPSGKFFTCLATPGLFDKGGWMPKQFSERYVLAGATVNTPRTVSGWDVGHNRPLPYRSAAPAGSVYFWQLKESAQWGEDPHGTCISDNEDDNQAGWGLCLRGDWQ